MIHTDDPLQLQLEQNAAAAAELAARIREAGVEYIYYQFLSLSGRVLAKVVPPTSWRGTSLAAFSSTVLR